MNKIKSKVFSEVYAYLRLMGNDYIKKLPKDKYETILEMKDDNYNPQYSMDDFNDNQKTEEQTRYMILLFYLDYWCESEDIRQNIIKKLNENERKLNEKYDPFKNKTKKYETQNIESNNVELIKYKESFISKIKKFLKKLKNNY